MNRAAPKLLAGIAVIGLAVALSTSIRAAGGSAQDQARESAASSACTAGSASSVDEKAAAFYVAEAEVWVVDAGGMP